MVTCAEEERDMVPPTGEVEEELILTWWYYAFFKISISVVNCMYF